MSFIDNMIIFLMFIFTSTLVAKTTSADISLKGDPCSKFDSCFSKPSLRTCSCEDNCQQYGTCCHDFKNTQNDSPSNTYSCYSRRTVTPVFVKRSCAEDFLGHIDYKIACLDGDEDEMDVKNNLLVTSHKTKVTYWNKHCAKCNKEANEDLEFWNIEVFCPQHKNVDRSLIRRNLTFDQDRKQWGLEVDGEFLHCSVKYAPPPYIDEVKPCSPNLISSCPDNYTNEETVVACSMYYAERKLKDRGIYYKNSHCAICNGANLTHLECAGMTTPEDNVDDNDFREMIGETFSQGTWLNREPGKNFECSKGYAYDPMWEMCRQDQTLITTVTPILNSSNINTMQKLVAIALLFISMYSY